MAHLLRRAFDHFYDTTKKGYNEISWIIAIIAGASIVTGLFGIGGAGASVVAFALFYFFGRISVKREERLEKEKLLEKKKKV